ncbi:hypothetical protein SNEBB_006124 [Seison nebaliae]|nr:hypothetical protein SNEBB_006124 [Seison nebaliae]
MFYILSFDSLYKAKPSMKMINRMISIYFVICTLLSFIQCNPNLYRDRYDREDPDALMGGFFAVWGAILFIMAAAFFAVAIIAGFGYVCGCRTPKHLLEEKK